MAKARSGSGLGIAVLANFAGSAWGTIISILFVPLYLRYLGVEGYGIVGFSTTLLAIVTLLDGGLTLTVNRQLARLSSSPSNAAQMLQTLSAGTVLFACLAALVTTVIWFGAPWIARDWLNAGSIGTEEVVLSLRLIGLVLGEQFLVALFQGALFGLHQQMAVNLVLIVASTVRAVGAALILKFVSAAPSAFFAWYVFTSLAQLVALRILLIFFIGAGTPFATPRVSMIKALLRQTGGFGAIAILSLLLSQIDKLLVSRLLPLQDFGYYMVAMSVSLVPLMVGGPFTNAIFPRLTRLAASDARSALDLLHLSTLLVTALVIPAGFTIALFSRELIFAWTGSAAITSHVAPLVSILVVGYAINASLQMSYYFEMAYARTRTIVVVNCVILLLLIPGVIVLARTFGAAGAAGCWLLINLGSLLIGMPIVMRKGLGTELRRYYTASLLPAYVVSAPVVVLARLLIPQGLSRISGGVLAIAVSAAAVAACILLIPALRGVAVQHGRRFYASVLRSG
jgi:O-antigen/teichoic acid export membrane protein